MAFYIKTLFFILKCQPISSITPSITPKVIERVKHAKKFVWIGTADIKDLHVKLGSLTVSFLADLNELAQKRVNIRLLHAKEPGVNFKNSFNSR